MDMPIRDRLKHAWQAFTGKEKIADYRNLGPPSGEPSDRRRQRFMTERSIISSIYNRIAVDASSVSMYHIRVDQNGRYKEKLNTALNDVLSVEANIDQSAKAFFRDLIYSMLDEGYIAAVPSKATDNPALTDSYDIKSLRRAKIVEWRPQFVTVEMYNELTGMMKQVTYPKKMVAIIENPFYSVMNAPNSTYQRLIKKLRILDAVDEQVGTGKLDMIIQLPYVIKTQARREEAEKRRSEIERQLSGSKLGIAYTDGTERIIQLNRPIDNNLMSQIEYLTNMLYSQLGITASVLNGEANEETMLNYYSRIIEPVLDAVVDEFIRKFLSKKARSTGQSIKYFRDQFKLTPTANLSEIAESLVGSGVLSSNEMRAILGYIPSDDPGADTLMRRNTKQPDNGQSSTPIRELTDPQPDNPEVNESGEQNA